MLFKVLKSFIKYVRVYIQTETNDWRDYYYKNNKTVFDIGVFRCTSLEPFISTQLLKTSSDDSLYVHITM